MPDKYCAEILDRIRLSQKPFTEVGYALFVGRITHRTTSLQGL
jgi:hypothetical protein